MRRWFKFILRLLLGLLLLVALYLLLAVVLSRITTEPGQTSGAKDIEIWLRSNGVHVDIVVPTTTPQIDWRTLVSPDDTRSGHTAMPWLAFGWGDRGFYLNTPEWKDLRFSTAFNAAFGLGKSAMHTTYHARMTASERSHRFMISQTNYNDLCTFLMAGFETTEEGALQPIGLHARYGEHDAFYAGNGRYSMVKTCNSWTNEAMKVAGLPHCLWTPFEGGLMRLGRKYGLTSDSTKTLGYLPHPRSH